MTCRRGSGTGCGFVQDDWQTPCELTEIPIRCEDGQIIPHGDGANEEVSVGSLNPFGAAQVEKHRGRYVVLGQHGQIGEGGQIGFESCELRLIAHSREKFLSDWPDNLGEVRANQAPQF